LTYRAVAIGDLNGDGKPDLAVATPPADLRRGPSSVSVFLNRGDGRLEPRVDYAVGAEPVSVAIGDLNGDGKPELATANVRGSNLSVLVNRGDGSFDARRDYRTIKYPQSVAIADLNGDGKPDLATAKDATASAADTVSVLLNRGDGTFQARRDRGGSNGGHSIAIADLNGDRKPDIVTGRYGDGVSVVLSGSGGRFGTKREYLTESAATSNSVKIGDLNGDGKPDLASASPLGGFAADGSSTSSVSVLLNRGDGSFEATRDYVPGRGTRSVAVGDLNCDGRPDLVTANSGDPNLDPTGSVSVLLNKGRNLFAAKRDFRAGRSPASVAVGDLNGDHKPDLVTANAGADTLSVLINTSSQCAAPNVQ
jgi:hypothetical protein